MALFQPASRRSNGTGPTSGIPQTQPARRSGSGYEAVYASRDFWTIRRRVTSFVVPACVSFLTWYFLFVIVAVFAPGFMRIHVIGDINVGLCFGAAQFASTFTLAVWYRRWAHRRLDPPSERLRHRLEGGRY